MLTLRPYQLAAQQAVYDHLRTRDDNPCVVIPTGGGKTPVIAAICRDAVRQWNGRVVLLTHVKELLEQSAEKLRAVDPDLDFGVYSAGLRRRETDSAVVVAGIQSVYQKACDLGRFDLAIVDEAHLIPPEGDGRYRQFLAEAKVVNPLLRVIGFTATPFRLKHGALCAPDGYLNDICYEIGVRALIDDGYLCPLVTKAGAGALDFNSLHLRGGEFVAGEAESLMDEEGLVRGACDELVALAADRQSVLIFASGVRHGRHVVETLAARHGLECGFVCGKTPPAERAELLERFQRGELKYLCNVNVLTTGFDAPQVDCVVLLRPTASAGLYYQMVGRGFRLHPAKQNCLVLDYGGNVLRHGPVDALEIQQRNRRPGGEAPAKECPACRSVVAAGCAECPDCGHAFPPPERAPHAAQASAAGILSGQISDEEFAVRDVRYRVHTKRGADEDAPKSLRVDYLVGLEDWRSEFICFEHQGYPRQKAEAWWRRRSPDPVPDTAERAAELAEAGALASTEAITVRSIAGKRFDEIVLHRLGAQPEAVAAWLDRYDEDEIPF